MRELRLDHNQITSIPVTANPNLGCHVSERSWPVACKQGKPGFGLPSEIGQLINLQWFYLNNNQITSIPSEIGQLINLQLLLLDNNQITSIPSEFGQLINLQQLNLCDNQITEIPLEIQNLPNCRIYK